MIGSLARQDGYELPDVGDPLVPSGPQVSPGVGWANRLFDRLPTAVMGGLAQMVETPGALMKANPYKPGTEEADFYDASKVATANEWAPGMALNMMGGGVAGVPSGGGQVLGAGPFRKLTGAVEGHPDYVYHATSVDRAHDIAESGLRRHKAHEYTDQDMWPDGSTEKRNYFTPTAQNTWQFAPEEGVPTLLRIRKDAHSFKNERGTGDLYSTKDVPANKFEYQHENGEWLPIVDPKKGDVILGSGATDKKMGAILAATDNQPQGIRAYHSSPHDFDKFDLSKIGTGEGAQVYGHGLYFAESPAVSGQGGQYWNQFLNRFSGTPEAEAAIYLKSAGFDREKAARMMQDHINKVIDAGGADPTSMSKKIQALKTLEGDKPVGPRTYEVNIKADPAHMLDWDKPISTQPHVEEALRRSGFKDAKWPYSGMQGELSGTSLQPLTSGEDAYRALGIERMGRNTPTPVLRRAATEAFAEAGIPGIKYLDAGSRANNIVDAQHLAALARHNGDWPAAVDDIMRTYHASPKDKAAYRAQLLRKAAPSSNYVIFDPSIIDIMKKYGIAGAAPAGMGALAAQDYYRNP